MRKPKKNTTFFLFPSQKNKIIIVSKPGAVIKVEKIELSDATRRSLTTSASSLGGTHRDAIEEKKDKSEF